MYDIVGQEDIDVSGDVGWLQGMNISQLVRRAQPAQAAIVQPAQPTAMALPAGSQGAVVAPQQPRGILRRQVLPIPATTVSAGGSTTITLQPQRAFRVERLVLGSTVTPSNCVVSDITVGANRQFVAAGDVPLAAFSPDAVGTGLRGDTANPGVTVTITLRNLGASSETVSGAFFGESLE